MSHMVIYRGADGKPGYQQAEDIHDAVTFVEQMRNGDGVEHARIFRLEEVVFEYRPYYRVELSAMGQPEQMMGAGSAPMAVAPAPAAEIPDDVSAVGGVNPMVAPVNSVTSLDEPFEVVEAAIDVDDPDPEAVASNGARRGLFGR